jgi:hypothetical protein
MTMTITNISRRAVVRALAAISATGGAGVALAAPSALDRVHGGRWEPQGGAASSELDSDQFETLNDLLAKFVAVLAAGTERENAAIAAYTQPEPPAELLVTRYRDKRTRPNLASCWLNGEVERGIDDYPLVRSFPQQTRYIASAWEIGQQIANPRSPFVVDRLDEFRRLHGVATRYEAELEQARISCGYREASEIASKAASAVYETAEAIIAETPSTARHAVIVCAAMLARHNVMRRHRGHWLTAENVRSLAAISELAEPRPRAA